MSRGTWTLVAAVAVMLAGAQSATAATQIGQTFVPTGDCGNDFTHLHTDPPGQYTIPSAGVVTSWSFQAAASAPEIEFKVARPGGGAQFTIVGESDRKSPVLNMLNTYPERISVQPGDVIGLYVSTSDLCAAPVAGFFPRSAMGDRPTGNTDTYMIAPVPARLDVSALVEPDCDGDGFGDETQDLELTGPSCPPPPKANRTLTLDANKSKVKKGKRVTLSGRLSAATGQGPCESSQTVELQRKRPKQTAFTTFAQVQTDTQGSFSLKKKLKKTFEFRAQVVETAACTAAQSNSEKVKVKKKRKR